MTEDEGDDDRPVSPPASPPSSEVATLPRLPTEEEQREQFMTIQTDSGGDGDQRFICLICSKSYTSRYNIRMHRNMHTGNNVHRCKFCFRHFAHKHVYESHVRTHTGERPFVSEQESYT